MRAYKCDVSGKYYDEPVQHEKVNLISYFYDEEKGSYEDEPKDYDVHPQVQQLILDVLIKEIPWEQKLLQLKLNIELMQQEENQKGPVRTITLKSAPEAPKKPLGIMEGAQPAIRLSKSFIDMDSYPDVHRVTVDGKTLYKNDYVERTYNDPKYAQMAATRYKNQGGPLMSTYVKEEEDDEEKQTSWTNKRKRFLIDNYDMPEHLATRQANHEWRNGDHDAEQPPKEIMALPDCSRDEEADNKKNDFINSRVEQYLKQPGVSKNDAKQWAENEYKEIYG